MLEQLHLDNAGAQNGELNGHGAVASGNLCPVSRAICMLEKKWTIHIIYELSTGKRRFCHLQDAIGNANSRTLSDRLKELEEQGLIHREVIHTIPPWVEYSLTD